MDAWRGGAETSTLQFVHELMERGVELHLFTRSRPSPAPGLHVHSIGGTALTRARKSVTFNRRVERRLREEQFDIVHAISPCRAADVYQPRGGTGAETIERNVAIRASGPARSLKRITSRLNLRQRYMLRLERELLSRPDGPVVVAISDYVSRQLKEHYQVPESRICKIYNAVAPDTDPPMVRDEHRRRIRKEFGAADEDFLVLTIAHNFRLKGVHRWMQALSVLQSRSVKGVLALVVGRGDSQVWHRSAGKLGLNGALTFVGPTERIREFYHAADVLVHPTYYDPCSRVVLEALSTGLPCLTTRWDGAAEAVIASGGGVVLADPGDVVELANQVETLRHPALRKRMSEGARGAAKGLTMSNHVSQMLGLYERVRSASAAPRLAAS
jgi:UDP-glucose:(heptosyl)LPS alpha-1,3-glucosyltransferase